MDIIQTFYDNLASEYDKLFLDWQVTTQEQALILDKLFRDNGFAQSAIIEVEKIHGKNYWELGTMLQEEGNCYLYEKMGYCRSGAITKINDKITIVGYEKN